MIQRIRDILEMIKFEHTLFALPFAYIGAMVGSLEVHGILPSWSQIIWILLAMIGARSAAMTLNRLIDRHIDAANPRTKNRHIPAGRVSIPWAWGFVIFSLGLLFYSAYQLNDLAVKLWPIAVFFLVIYSYTKRFTWACHFVLGITTGLGPLGGWIATTGQIDGQAILLFVSVALWIGGFDIIYGCQDVEFDRKEGVYSIPARFGVRRALQISSWMHVGTAFGLIGFFFITDLGIWFAIGVLIALAILFYEHRMVSADDLSRLNTAFFTMNGTLSMVVFIFTLLDVL